MDRNSRIIVILEKDFEELTPEELQIIRNETRKTYGIQGKIGIQKILYSFLIMKRKFVTNLEQVLVAPKVSEKDFGPFSGTKTVTNRIPVPTFDGLNGSPGGMFYISEHTYLPVMTVSYLEDSTEVICLSPEGSFCKISSKEFDFEI